MLDDSATRLDDGAACTESLLRGAFREIERIFEGTGAGVREAMSALVRLVFRNG